MTRYELNVGLRLGDQFKYHVGGALYTDTVESVRYSSGSPDVYRTLNRWRWMIRRLTPRRWRKSLLISPGTLATVTINGDDNPVGKTLQQLEHMKGYFDRTWD